jgi:phosphoglycolate phosphatase
VRDVRRYDLLIFDWDGTLADSAGMIVHAMQAAIAGLELPPRSDAQISQLIGLGLTEALRELYPEFEPADLLRLLEGYRARWLASGGGEAPLFEGALPAIRELHGHGYRLAVATGKARRGLDRSLAHHHELKVMIRCSRCADETASKPDPLMLRELLAHEEVDPQRALMVGDTEYDMAMARAIGMPALGVTCGVHHPERLLASGAIALLDDVRALPRWLGH